MAYSADSFVADEQPTTAKWNKLWTNDAAMNDGSGIADDAILERHILDGEVTSEKLTASIAARGYRNAAMNITGGGGSEKISIDAEDFDEGSDLDIGNGRFVAPVTGYYQVNMNVSFTNVDANGVAIAEIFVNGAVVSSFWDYSTAAANDPRVNGSDLVYAVAGQYIELYGDCSTTEALSTGSAATWMSVYFVGTEV